MSFSYICLLIVPTVLSYVYLNKSLFRCILGPYGYYLFHIIVIISVITNIVIEISRFFPYYQPFEFIFQIAGLFKRTAIVIVKPLYDALAIIFRKTWKALYMISLEISKLFKFIVNLVKDIILGIFNGIKFTIVSIFGLYSGILEILCSILFNMGMLGDIVLTVITIIWMFWPLYITYYYYFDSMAVKICSVIFSIIFMLNGFKTI